MCLRSASWLKSALLRNYKSDCQRLTWRERKNRKTKKPISLTTCVRNITCQRAKRSSSLSCPIGRECAVISYADAETTLSFWRSSIKSENTAKANIQKSLASASKMPKSHFSDLLFKYTANSRIVTSIESTILLFRRKRLSYTFVWCIHSSLVKITFWLWPFKRTLPKTYKWWFLAPLPTAPLPPLSSLTSPPLHLSPQCWQFSPKKVRFACKDSHPIRALA